MPDSDKLRRVLEAVQRGSPEPQKMKDIAQAAALSANTVGKYVDLAEAKELVHTDRYGSVRRVWLTDAGKRWLGTPGEAKGRGRK